MTLARTIQPKSAQCSVKSLRSNAYLSICAGAYHN
jgi:hypothetical protein